MIHIQGVDLDIRREPLVHPFGFKGATFTEKWLASVTLTSGAGHTVCGLAGFAVLWSDAEVFFDHTEAGGNLVMAAMLEHALKLARQTPFDHPQALLETLRPAVHAYGQQITQNPQLRHTFTLNALVALDNAAWRLYAAERGSPPFDSLIPSDAAPALAHHHQKLARIPLVSYKVALPEVRKLAETGHFIFKIKLGAAGEPADMLETDLQRVGQIHDTIGDASTPHTADGRIRYYFDANGRYPDLAWIQRFMDGVERLGIREQVLMLEEPLPENCRQPVGDLGVLVAADESLHRVEDVRERVDLGYGALALKPAGKTLSLTMKMAAEAHRLGLPCFVADSACTPRMGYWNRQIAARLAPLPGLDMGCIESNGAQHYRRWEEMLQTHPKAAAPWLSPRNGVYQLNRQFYDADTGSGFSPTSSPTSSTTSPVETG